MFPSLFLMQVYYRGVMNQSLYWYQFELITKKEKGQLQCCRGSEGCLKDVILLLLDCLEDEKKKNKSCDYVQSKA